jgi:hypothetical protein
MESNMYESNEKRELQDGRTSKQEKEQENGEKNTKQKKRQEIRVEEKIKKEGYEKTDKD